MAFLDTVRNKIGSEHWAELERVAEKEVARAMGMPLLDADKKENFYQQSLLLGELLGECDLFERAGLRILPTDVVNILFKCKLLRATNGEREYFQRSGGHSLFKTSGPLPSWSERSEPLDVLIDRYFNSLEKEIVERTLLTRVSSFSSVSSDSDPQGFFQRLFSALALPFVSFFDDDYHLVEKHKRFEPRLLSYDPAAATRFFTAPSLGYKASGSRVYCFWHASILLRTFLNLLRIASYVYPGQRDFGRDVNMCAPTFPVFLGEHATGALQWQEDAKESWAKIPDGCLFLSFGYRGLSNMWLDLRTFPRLEKFICNHKVILNSLKNPWNPKNIMDIAPILDILSSATQIPDLGAKVLLIYCCLEHLFVPVNAYTENKKYIIGGMNALSPELLPWFNNLYNLRCSYAHKGFVLRDDQTMILIAESMKNVMKLLVGKLSVS